MSGEAARTGARPSEEELLGWMSSLSNWGRWGADDELGTLNHVTQARTRQAAELIATGERVSCARPWQWARGNEPDAPEPPSHEMIDVFDNDRPGPDPDDQFAYDRVGVRFHSREVTHVDALSHCFWDGKMYNGRSSGEVSSTNGAGVFGIDVARGGFVTRAILVDAAWLRGVESLDAGTGVGLDDLAAAKDQCGISPRPGDVVLFRGGQPNGRCGPLPEILPLVAEREVAMVGSDMGNEARPSGYSRLVSPLHQVGIVTLGLWLLDAALLEELAATCRRLGRWEFFFSVAPLPMPGVTGSPVNPIAVF